MVFCISNNWFAYWRWRLICLISMIFKCDTYSSSCTSYSVSDEPPEGFGVGPKTLIHLLQDRKLSELEKLGGVSALTDWSVQYTLATLGYIFRSYFIHNDEMDSFFQCNGVIFSQDFSLMRCRSLVWPGNSVQTGKTVSKMILRKSRRGKRPMDQIHIQRKNRRAYG